MKITQAPDRPLGPTPASARRFYPKPPSPSGEPASGGSAPLSVEQAERFGHSLERLRQPAPAPAEPTNAPVQRLVSVKAGKNSIDRASSINARNPGLVEALKGVPQDQHAQIIETLNSLAEEGKVHKFNNWDTAVNRAKSVAKSQSQRTRVKRNRDLPAQAVESEDSSSEESSGASESGSDFSESDNDEGLPEVHFDESGHFANKGGKKLSKTRRSALITSLGLTHTDTGHGPHKTEKQISDAALLQKGAGKFTSDVSMFRALKRTKQAIRKGEIDPEKGGNQFIRMPRKASVAFKKSGEKAKKVETRKGRVFFKKGNIKSIHPFAEDAAEDADDEL